MKVASAQSNLIVGDFQGNGPEIRPFAAGVRSRGVANPRS